MNTNYCKVLNSKIVLYKCPFCGGEPTLIKIEDNKLIHYKIQCSSCGAGTSLEQDEIRAAGKWNKSSYRFSYTPGPWTVSYNEDFHEILEKKNLPEIGFANGKLIAKVKNYGDGHSGINAKIISKSPELFELAKYFKNIIDTKSKYSELQDYRFYEELCNIISDIEKGVKF